MPYINIKCGPINYLVSISIKHLTIVANLKSFACNFLRFFRPKKMLVEVKMNYNRMNGPYFLLPFGVRRREALYFKTDVMSARGKSAGKFEIIVVGVSVDPSFMGVALRKRRENSLRIYVVLSRPGQSRYTEIGNQRRKFGNKE